MTAEKITDGRTMSEISTHTLRGERDMDPIISKVEYLISTHTLRGERDMLGKRPYPATYNFNSHAPWGA